MRHPWLTLALLSAVSCTPPPVTPRSSGSIAVSNDDALLFVADADHDELVVLDAKTGAVLRQTPVPRQPERVLVAPDGTVFVSSRGARSVTRLSPGGEVIEASATVGAEPVGLALSADQSQLLVANSRSGTITFLDAQRLEARSELEVGGMPWAVTATPDGRRLYVTDFSGGAVRVVDLDRGGRVSLTLEQAPQAECQWGLVAPRTPAQAADVVLSPDGERVYVAHVQSRTGLNAPSGVAPGTLRLAVAPALSTIETSSNSVLRDTARSLDGLQAGVLPDFPAALLSTNLDQACQVSTGGTGMDAPSSLVVDGRGEWIFVADHNSNAVAVVSATGRVDERYRVPERGISDVVRVGARPTGIAVAGDLTRAWVHNSLDYSVSLVEMQGGRLAQTRVFSFSRPTLPAAVERGRRLFYSAVDPRLTEPEFGGVSCSSCHPHGGADALSWVLPEEREPWSAPRTLVARNTPPLWGVGKTAPYHWDGALADLPSFSARMVGQMGGQGLSGGDVADLSAFMETINAPDNLAAGRLAPGLIARGEALFGERCQGCHAGPMLTDGRAHATRVGEVRMLDTPSLKGVFATAPYLHDGSAATLRQVLTSSAASMVEHDQRVLSAGDLEALEAFVATR
jgi:DNA-binding beta-propeller fold protein YncE/mono/diheme cytochrome c family protein